MITSVTTPLTLKFWARPKLVTKVNEIRIMSFLMNFQFVYPLKLSDELMKSIKTTSIKNIHHDVI